MLHFRRRLDATINQLVLDEASRLTIFLTEEDENDLTEEDENDLCSEIIEDLDAGDGAPFGAQSYRLFPRGRAHGERSYIEFYEDDRPGPFQVYIDEVNDTSAVA